MSDQPFVSRGGLKLDHAIRSLGVDVKAKLCADFGCSTGGFTDCLLKAGAARVVSIDTGYGVLAWTLRNDQRVVVMERTNCLHAPLPDAIAALGGVEIVVIDASWTPQRLVIPAALRWLKNNAESRIITLVKPHYEDKPLAQKHKGLLSDELGEPVARRVIDEMPSLGVRVLGWCASPVRGLAGKSEAKGNLEYLAVLARK